MALALSHRGPDGDGVCALPGASAAVAGWFGHRRLKILDLTDAAHQPMRSRDEAVSIVFNGEVYNFRALRRELEAIGHQFVSTGDTEVVLKAFQEWGGAFAERLDGMFAIAVWDAREQRLHLVRDRVGKKPLFYAHRDGRVTFGSEVKALGRAPWIPLEPDPAQIPALLTFGYVPWPETPYAGIRQVAPAGHIVYDPHLDRLAEHHYWSPRGNEAPPRGRALHAEVARRVEAATSRRLVADVPIGCLLSGGIDSSVVAALMTRTVPEPVHTFTAGFPEERSFDERPWARRVADALGTRHTEFAVRVDALKLLDRLIHHYDGPFADSSGIPTYLVCGLARESVTVVLTGDGGDEVFAGYERFTAAMMAERLPAVLTRALPRVAAILPHGTSYASLRRRLERFGSATGPVDEQYLAWISIADREALRELGVRADRDPTGPFQTLLREIPGPVLDRILHANFRSYLPDDLAVKVDRMSMAHGLEVRSPFLDTAVIELLASVPAREKIGLRRIKPVMRRAFGPLIPESIWRRPKHGFGSPVDAWFEHDLGEVFADEVLARDGRVQSRLDRGALERMHREHRERRARHGGRLWTLLTIERWLRECERPEPFGAVREPVLDVVVR